MRSANPAREKVLLVDDVESVRFATGLVLEQSGYHVFEAESAEAALCLVKDMAEPLDFLISDMYLAGKNGLELAEQVLLIFPDIKIILMSGDLIRSPKKYAFLQKPFSPDQLLKEVNRTLS